MYKPRMSLLSLQPGAGYAALFLSLLLLSAPASAELEELDDEKLEELRGKEGVTIDLSYKLSIGEIAWKFSDQEYDDDRSKTTLAPPPPRIEYHVNGK